MLLKLLLLMLLLLLLVLMMMLMLMLMLPMPSFLKVLLVGASFLLVVPGGGWLSAGRY